MTVATLAKENLLPIDQALPVSIVGLCLLYAFVIVYRRLLRGIQLRGGQVRSDLFGLPDTLVVLLLTVLVLLALVMQWLFPATAAGRDAMKNATSVLLLSAPMILALIVVRGISFPVLFGLKRVGPLRALGTGAGLVVLLLPVIVIATIISLQFLGSQASEQEAVKVFREVAKAGKPKAIWNAIISIAIVAPFLEEVLFRGYLYPVMKRSVGPLPAALAAAMIFGAVHNNAAGFPVLTVLALALTLAYEWAGSILVPICMHMCFNAGNLAVMWWQATHGTRP